MHYVMIAQYRGLVKDCTIGGCDGTPVFVARLDGSTAPGANQVACRSHIGDVAGNMMKTAVPVKASTPEEFMAEVGGRFEWSDDWGIGGPEAHVAEFDCYEGTSGPETCESCVLYDGDDNILASLGCIDDASEDYRREIEADLIREAMPA